jgi:uncharacterized protein (DUF1697 family)
MGETTFVFLRGVNVGGRTLKMAGLVNHLKENGFPRTSSFLASGNLIMQDPISSKREKVKDLISEYANMSLEIFFRSRSELQAICDSVDRDGLAIHIAFVAKPLSELNQSKLQDLGSENQILVCRKHEFIWYSIDCTMSKSPLFKVNFEKLLDTSVSMRNIRTLQRLLAK